MLKINYFDKTQIFFLFHNFIIQDKHISKSHFKHFKVPYEFSHYYLHILQEVEFY